MDSNGSNEALTFAQRIGIIPVSAENNFGQVDVKNAVVFLPAPSTRLFFDHDMAYCKNESQEMLCLKQMDYFTFSEVFELSEITGILKSLKIDPEYKLSIAKDFVSYIKMKKAVQDEFKPNANDSEIFTIKQMYEKWPSKHLNWLPMINNQLLSDSQRTLNDTILIHNPLLLEGLYKVFVDLEEK